jgi:hypothetical protein
MIIFIVILIVLIIIIIRSYTVNNNILTKLSDAKLQQVIPSGSLATSSNPQSNYAYSIWFYINDWNYRYNDEKIIFAKNELNTPSDTTGNGTNPQPSVSLDAYNNNLIIEITCYKNNGLAIFLGPISSLTVPFGRLTSLAADRAAYLRPISRP